MTIAHSAEWIFGLIRLITIIFVYSHYVFVGGKGRKFSANNDTLTHPIFGCAQNVCIHPKECCLPVCIYYHENRPKRGQIFDSLLLGRCRYMNVCQIYCYAICTHLWIMISVKCRQ